MSTSSSTKTKNNISKVELDEQKEKELEGETEAERKSRIAKTKIVGILDFLDEKKKKYFPDCPENYTNEKGEYVNEFFPKEVLDKYVEIRSMIKGAERWPLFGCVGQKCIITHAGSDERPIRMILNEMEEIGIIVKVKDYHMEQPFDFKNDRILPEKKVFTGNEFYMTKELAIEKGNFDIKCRYCEKRFSDPRERNKHYRVHGFVSPDPIT